jgi:hypothetical protein
VKGESAPWSIVDVPLQLEITTPPESTWSMIEVWALAE